MDCTRGSRELGLQSQERCVSPIPSLRDMAELLGKNRFCGEKVRGDLTILPKMWRSGGCFFTFNREVGGVLLLHVVHLLYR